jgi:hypothetical protein
MSAFFTQEFAGTGSAEKIVDSAEFDRAVTVSTNNPGTNDTTSLGYSDTAIHFGIPPNEHMVTIGLPAGYELYAAIPTGYVVWIFVGVPT